MPKAKKNKVKWYCEGEVEMIYGLRDLAENKGIDTEFDYSDDPGCVYYDEYKKALVFIDDSTSIDFNLPFEDRPDYYDLEQACSAIVYLAKEKAKKQASRATEIEILDDRYNDSMTAYVYGSGVRIEDQYGKRCWIGVDDLKSITDVCMEM